LQGGRRRGGLPRCAHPHYADESPPLPACGERSAAEGSRVRGNFNMRGANLLRTARARRLRRDASDAELKLWNKLRSRSICGFKFVRQEPLGPFTVDFVCREQRLVIEVDGGQHTTDQRDASRDEWLAQRGYRVLRFWNNDVLRNTDGVLELIAATLNGEAPPHPDCRS
jgi:very-short-patch-repair endonuclease